MFAEYKVKLEAFEGPLDLLLFLIRRAEVDINDIPVAAITGQYLDYLAQLTTPVEDAEPARLDIERAGEFLVMAATLMEIKSRMLAPPLSGDEDAEPAAREAAVLKRDGDPRADLVRQLLEFKRFRDATEKLDDRRSDWDRRFPLGAAARPEMPAVDEADIEVPTELEDMDLIDLVEAFARILETVDLARVGEHHVQMDDTPVELHAEDILDRLRRRAADSLTAEIAGTGNSEIEFAEVFTGRSRSEMIGLFLAMLELVKQRRIAFRQDGIKGGIFLLLAPEEDTVQAAPPASEQAGGIGSTPMPSIHETDV